MAYFNNKKVITEPLPIPVDPPYVPPAPPTPPTPQPGGAASVVHPTHTGNYNMSLYTNYSNNNVLNKNIVKIVDITDIALKDDTSIEDPVMIIETTADLTNCNYAYVDEWDKYFYITNIELIPGGLHRLYMHVDVLMTYADEIKNIPATIERNETNYNQYINDGTYISDSREFITCVNFSNGFNDSGEFILITAGGVPTL